MSGVYLYLMIIIAILIFLGVKVFSQKKLEKKTYEEREDNVFYDAAKNIRRD